MSAVEVESLTITYGQLTAVDALSFRAEAGQVTCLLGPNGAGKTSTVEALEGLRRPTSGRLSVIGLDPRRDHRALTRRIGVMLQEGGVHPGVRVHEALRHAAALYPEPLDPAALLDQLGLAGLAGRTYRQLSGGEQRRVALALALVGRPQVAFLDEPTAGVDPAGRQIIRQVVADLRGEGVTVLLTTHDLDEAERIADRVVIIVGGRLVAAGTVDHLRRAGDDDRVRFRAPPGIDRGALSRHLAGAEVVETAPGDYAVAAAPTPQTVAAITAWLAEQDLPLADLRAGRQRLEDVYLRLTSEPGAETSPTSPTSRGAGTGPAPADPGSHPAAVAPDGPAVPAASPPDDATPGPSPPGTEPDPPGGAATPRQSDPSAGNDDAPSTPPPGDRGS